jgi:hypothetical protein
MPICCDPTRPRFLGIDMPNRDGSEENRRAALHHRRIAETYRALSDGALIRSLQSAYNRIAEAHMKLAALQEEAAFSARAGYRRLVDLNR